MCDEVGLQNDSVIRRFLEHFNLVSTNLTLAPEKL